MIARAHALSLVAVSFSLLAVLPQSPAAAAPDRSSALRTASRRPHAKDVGSKLPNGSVRIHNGEGSALLSLSLATDGGLPDIVARGVRSGASVVVQLPKPGQCIYDIEARFEDWSWIRVPSFDLCKNPTLNVGESSSPGASPESSAESASSPPTGPAKSAAPRKASVEESPASRRTIARAAAEADKRVASSRERVRVENHRKTMLLVLTFGIRGEIPHVVAERVPSGRSVVVALPVPGQCVYDIEGDFADNSGTSIPGFNLCKDRTLNFLN